MAVGTTARNTSSPIVVERRREPEPAGRDGRDRQDDPAEQESVAGDGALVDCDKWAPSQQGERRERRAGERRQPGPG